MPEGPEIRRAADRLSRVLAGRRIERLYFAFPTLKKWETRLEGLQLQSVDTLGKHMLCRFDDGTCIYSHNQLYGRWCVRPLDQYPDTGRQLRLALHTDRHSALLYSASDIDVVTAADLPNHARLRGLGPDPLDRDVDRGAVIARLDAAPFRGRQLASLLLDQGFMAGLGNYLRSEILFAAGIHPKVRPRDCDPQALARLARAILTLTRRSYRTGGVTNSPSVYRRLRNSGKARGAARFAVFSRRGLPCLVCGTPVCRDNMGGRRVYYCRDCQPPGRV
ncbi:MAG: endonuclease VIII [Gammaproteobacteria bacterium]|nr:MAG: endonuclease VIII [Gammaproteobacteria bacterium]